MGISFTWAAIGLSEACIRSIFAQPTNVDIKDFCGNVQSKNDESRIQKELRVTKVPVRILVSGMQRYLWGGCPKSASREGILTIWKQINTHGKYAASEC